jgi:hypothetical protein
MEVTPCGRVIFEKLIVSHLAKKLLSFYESGMLISMFISAVHCPYPGPDYFRHILTSYSFLRLCPTCGLFHSGFLTEKLYVFTYRPHASTTSSTIMFGEKYKT